MIYEEPNAAHPEGWFDYDGCLEAIVERTTAKELAERFGLVLGFNDERTDEELNFRGDATLFFDTRGKVIAFFCHNPGVVMSIPEWKDVDWEEVASRV